MIKYGYFVTYPETKKTGYITVAVNRPGKDDKDQTHNVSFAFCSPKDNKKFSKSHGRNIAEKRLLSGKSRYSVDIVNNSCNVSEIIEAALLEIANKNIVPSWVARAIKTNRIQKGLSHCYSQGIKTGS